MFLSENLFIFRQFFFSTYLNSVYIYFSFERNPIFHLYSFDYNFLQNSSIRTGIACCMLCECSLVEIYFLKNFSISLYHHCLQLCMCNLLPLAAFQFLFSIPAHIHQGMCKTVNALKKDRLDRQIDSCKQQYSVLCVI